MTELTSEQLEEKIKQVEKDIEALRLTGESSRKLEVLGQYNEYLKDELELLKKELRERQKTQKV